MGKPAAYYNSDDFNKYKKTQGKCIPPRSNVLAAACHIQALFDTKRFTYGFLGGLPMLCMGYKREMPDLHVAYDDRDFDRLTAKLGSDRRVRLPTGMNPLLPFKILVWTGPDYKDLGCAVNASIELDLIPSGSCGTPSAGTLSHNVIHLGLKTASGNQMIFKSLNFRYQLATLLSYCQVRDLLWDPRKDILYLCKSENSEVRSCRGQLNIKHLKELFLGTSFFSRLSLEDQRLCYRTLLDTEPPPTMSVTPPDPQVPVQPKSKPKDLEQNADARTPRSRYRHTNGQRSSSNGLPIAQDTMPRGSEQVQNTAHAFNIQGVQCVQSARPQKVSTANATRKAHNSMPNLQATQDATTSHHSSLQTSRQATARHEHHKSLQLIHTPGQQASISSQQTQTGSNLEYGGAFRPAYIQKRDENINVGRSPPSGRDISPRRTDSAKSDPTATPVREIRSQKGSLHVVSPEEPEPILQKDFKEDTPVRGRLHLVGPEGVYGAPDAACKNSQSQNQQQRHRSAPPPLSSQHNSVFELDATEAPKPTFIAELPASPVISSSVQPQAHFHERSNLQASRRPSNPRAQSEPFEVASLPPSLAIRGPGARTHRQSISHSQASNVADVGFSTHQTNAYRYSSFVYPHSGSSESLTGSFEKAEAPSYKPYRPFILTDELDRHDSVSSVYSPRHKRDASDDSTASHDSSKLAKEYQDLLSPVKACGDD